MPHFVRPRSQRCSERAISAGERLREEGVVEAHDETCVEVLMVSSSSLVTIGLPRTLTALMPTGFEVKNSV